jgi:ethanolaminephosphotransferase
LETKGGQKGYVFVCKLSRLQWPSGTDNGPAYLAVVHDLISLFLITQTRASNIPLFLIFYMQFTALLGCRLSSISDLTVTALLLQYSSFFVTGGSNAISSVDLSNAYNGIAGYNVLAVGILTFIGNWAGPIWWVFATAVIMSANRAVKRRAVFEHFALLTLFTAFSTLSVMVACMVLREHLFIWTVFSPKFLFTVAWVVGHHVLVNGFLGYGLLSTLVPEKP